MNLIYDVVILKTALSDVYFYRVMYPYIIVPRIG